MKKLIPCLSILLFCQLVDFTPRSLLLTTSRGGTATSVATLALFLQNFTPTPCAAQEKRKKKSPAAAAIIEDNKVYQNVLAGIRVTGSTPVTIQACDVYENGQAGINAERQAQLKIIETAIFQNGRGGIDVENAQGLSLAQVKIFKNKMGGVRLQKTTGQKKLFVTVEDSRIFLNEEAGIRSMPTPDDVKGNVELTLTGNTIYQNKMSGIRVENNTKLVAKGNTIYENGTAGLIAHDSEKVPVLDIYQNKIYANIGPGIHVYVGRSGRLGIRNNLIYNNERSGIICALRDREISRLIDIEVINNTIVANGSKDQGAGVRNDSDGKVTIINNIIAYNYVTGIRTSGCDDYSYNLFYANGHVGNCCDDPKTAPFYVEKVQVAGCSGRGEGGLIADPHFANIDDFNFSLQSTSPAIGTAKDLFSEENISSPNNDIGATGGPYAAK